MEELHSDAVRALTDWRAPDAHQAQLRAEFLALLAARPDATTRTCVPAHITASALVLDPTGEHVLLVLHRKVRLWMQMGGHCEAADASVAAAALREAVEEAGISALRLLPRPVELDKHAAPCAPGVADWHFDVRYVGVADRAERPVMSQESLDVRWWPADELPPDAVPDLSRLVQIARAAVVG